MGTLQGQAEAEQPSKTGGVKGQEVADTAVDGTEVTEVKTDS